MLSLLHLIMRLILLWELLSEQHPSEKIYLVHCKEDDRADDLQDRGDEAGSTERGNHGAGKITRRTAGVYLCVCLCVYLYCMCMCICMCM